MSNTLTLEKLLSAIDVPYRLYGKNDVVINDLRLSSQEVKPGDCFFAVRGMKADGHAFIEDAINRGATVVVCEDGRIESFNPGVSYVVTTDVTEILGLFADIFFGKPSEKLKVIGVTGTNGKTTVATMIYRMLAGFHRKAGLVSTVENIISGEILPATRTTPDAITLHSLLAKMVAAGCEYAVMEVSSHATAQNRIKGVRFAGAVFTNLSHDHLDYHHTIENYANAKKLFFDGLSDTAFALTNVDDEYGRFMVQDTAAKIYTYGFTNTADFNEIIECRLVGQFNQYNMLAVYAVGTLLGFESPNIKKVLSNLEPPRGRFELVVDENGIRGIVDYAHTPDGVENVLAAARNLVKDGGRLIAVLGCGGDRDESKRPVMARIAYDMADIVILTSDNPRSEDPDKILHEMKAGLPALSEVEGLDDTKEVFVITDRREAIRKAKEVSRENDIIMLLGKGHETYQEVKDERYHFDDKEELQKAFS